MRTLSFVCLAVVSSLIPLASNASVTNVTYHADGDGAITCPVYTWPGGTTIQIMGDQFWGPGDIVGQIQPDGMVDPTLTLANNINNDTGFAWTGYLVDISMNTSFTIGGPPTVTVPADWTIASVMQPGAPVGGVYTGHIVLESGTPVAPGGQLDFSYSVTFSGPVSFTETLTPVPEPGMLSLAFCGLLLAGWTIRRR